MVKSKFDDAWVGFLVFMGIVCLLLFVISSSQYFFGIRLFGAGFKDRSPALPACVFGLIMSVIFFRIIARQVHTIEIDTSAQTILFRNLIGGKQKMYAFSDLDGYIDTLQRSRRGTHKFLYFVRKGRIVSIISGGIYANIQEIETALQGVKHLGHKKLDLSTRIAVLFGKPVLNS